MVKDFHNQDSVPQGTFWNLDDGFLVNEACKGTPGAFDVLVQRYYRRIGALIYQKTGSSPDVEDLVQDTFTKAFAAIRQLKEPGKFASWLYQIAGKTVIDYFRKARLRRTASRDEMRDNSYEPPAGAKEEVEPDTYALVMKAIAEFPDSYRLAVTLRFMEGMSTREIAEHLGEPQGTIRNRLFRANAILKEKLKGLW